jgi:isoleucyl-tRNA synthetase
VSIDDGPEIEIGHDDVVLTREVLEGWGIASDAGVTVALELELTPALRAEGMARELIRIVQDARKAADLEVSDRIALGIVAGGAVADARDAHAALIAAETLATAFGRVGVEDPDHRTTVEIEEQSVEVSLRRISSG